MAERNDDQGQFDSHTLGVYRTAATVKGGRRFSFGALVVVGDRRGRVGYGYGKAPDVPGAIEKATKRARKTAITVPLQGSTIPHEVTGRYGTSKTRMIPASPGTGVVAGSTVRAVLEMAGISDCLTKCYGSTTALNVVKGLFEGLGRLRRAEEIAELRGVELEKTETQEKIERGSRFMGARSQAEEGQEGEQQGEPVAAAAEGGEQPPAGGSNEG